MNRILPAVFFDRDTLAVAPQMLGKFLVRHAKDAVIASMITEVEAYIGPEDLACHASKGRTPRTSILYGPPGTLYIYFVYGIHWMLNVVTREEGFPAAVLLRGTTDVIGPARLTKYFAIDGSLNGQPAIAKAGLWFEDRGVVVPTKSILRTPRIGVDYAGEWAEKPYRFLLASEASSAAKASKGKVLAQRK